MSQGSGRLAMNGERGRFSPIPPSGPPTVFDGHDFPEEVLTDNGRFTAPLGKSHLAEFGRCVPHAAHEDSDYLVCY